MRKNIASKKNSLKDNLIREEKRCINEFLLLKQAKVDEIISLSRGTLRKLESLSKPCNDESLQSADENIDKPRTKDLYYHIDDQSEYFLQDETNTITPNEQSPIENSSNVNIHVSTQ